MKDPMRLVDRFLYKHPRFCIPGLAKYIAVGSGAIETEEVFFGNSYSTFHGRMLAVLRAGRETGTVTVTAAADGLEPVSTTIEVK